MNKKTRTINKIQIGDTVTFKEDYDPETVFFFFEEECSQTGEVIEKYDSDGSVVVDFGGLYDYICKPEKLKVESKCHG